MNEQFVPYGERRPPTVGVYRWRVPNRHAKDLTVEFCAHMRKRGAGHEDVISPVFDHWDGYRVHVPAGTLWQPCEGVVCKPHQSVHISPLGVELMRCPFCTAIPSWHGCEYSSSGGIYVGSDPDRYNTWWLECCSWVKTPHMADPRVLAERRNAMLSR